MRTLRTASAAAALCVLLSYAVSASAAPANPIEVTAAHSRVSSVVGKHFRYVLHIANRGTTSTEKLIVHLNVASLTSDVYVDPEDWSSARSIVLAPLEPGRRTPVSWDVQAVNAGSFVVYAVVLPDGAGSAGRGPLVVSPPTHVTVADRQTLNAGGSLPLAVAVPLLLAALVVGIRVRRRRAATP